MSSKKDNPAIEWNPDSLEVPDVQSISLKDFIHLLFNPHLGGNHTTIDQKNKWCLQIAQFLYLVAETKSLEFKRTQTKDIVAKYLQSVHSWHYPAAKSPEAYYKVKFKKNNLLGWRSLVAGELEGTKEPTKEQKMECYLYECAVLVGTAHGYIPRDTTIDCAMNGLEFVLLLEDKETEEQFRGLLISFYKGTRTGCI